MALKIQKGVNDLATTHPELAGQWHPTKNGELTPEDVTASTSKKVWWYLPYDVPEDYPVAHLRGKHYDFEWEVPVGRRVNSVNAGKVGYPFLTGRSIWIGFNDLQTVRPDLAIQWHPTKNGDLTPTDVTVKSAKKVWWQCSAGHEWESKVYGRANGLNCPYCSGKLPVGGENDLASTHPHIAAEWNYKKNKNLKDRNGRDISTPNKISAHSNQKVWWKCPICGYEWLSVVNDRTDNCGCPVCAGKKLAQGINDLATVNPELLREWDYSKNIKLNPSSVRYNSKEKAWWLCNEGHSWEAPIYSRTLNNISCPYCEGRLPFLGETDLATTHPEIAAEWDYEANKGLKDGYGRDVSIPQSVTAGSGLRVGWKCAHGHKWNSLISSRTRGDDCPYCSGKLPIIGVTDLETVNPELSKEWNYNKNKNLKDGNGRDVSSPDKVAIGSHQKVWWLCSVCGYEWNTAVRDRAISDYHCPCCSGKVPIPEKNDLQTINPKLAKEWDYEANKGLTDGNGRDISSPSKVLPWSRQKVGWKCKHGHTWKSRISDRMSGDGCPICARRIPTTGINDLKTTHPELVKEWHPTQNIGLMDKTGRDISTPDKVSAGSHQKVWWKCLICGREWESSIYNRATLDNGCPQCAESKGEKAIRKILETNNIKFEAQYKFKDRFLISKRTPLRDDFAILNQNGKVVAAIEYNGIQHYFPVDFAGKGKVWAEEALKATQERDKIKSDYLKARNIPQLIIPYWDFDNIGKIVNVFIDELYKTTILV